MKKLTKTLKTDTYASKHSFYESDINYHFQIKLPFHLKRLLLKLLTPRSLG